MTASILGKLRAITADGSLLLFPLGALLNSFSMTGLLLVYGLAGQMETAADIGLVQAATLALFYAFSANGRNLVLGDATGRVGSQLLKARLLLLLPLMLASWFLSVHVGMAGGLLAGVLILRRASEWMGEIGLALHERGHAPRYAREYLVVEGGTLLLTAVVPLFTDVPLAVCAVPWALVPLLSLRGIGAYEEGPGRLSLRELLPHFGSTAAVGISTYVFRISIAILAGKALAGELFTAFAIGGLLPTLFGQGLAPTLAHRYRDRSLPSWLLAVPVVIVAVALGAVVVVHTQPDLVAGGRHSVQFWMASALSIAGGALMGVALMLRTRLIQNMQGGQVYGPDLMANLLIATCVPYVFYLLGPGALGGLYLLSALLNTAFYWRAGHIQDPANRDRGMLLAGVAVMLVMPVFVQLSGGLFVDKAVVFDPAGAISRLPVPLSVAGVFVGIALLGSYATAIRTLTTVFFTATLFIIGSLVVSAGVQAYEGAKLILLAQFLLPMFGLILGEMYGAASAKPWFERGAATVLLVVLPAQMLATWMTAHTVARPHVFFFSIYQHLQYFPMVVVAVTLMATMSLLKDAPPWRWAALALWPLALLHSAASLSIASASAAIAGLAFFIVYHARSPKHRPLVFGLAALALALAGTYASLANSGQLSRWLAKPDVDVVAEIRWSDKLAAPSAAPLADHPRWFYWREYAKGTLSSFKTFMIGHPSPPDRKVFPSAHNYWLDALYNFGLVAMLPLILLLGATLQMAWARRKALSSDAALTGTLLAMLYLVLFENMLKVGMRQPYPGLMAFFIWGLLISRLRAHPALGKSGGGA